MALDQVEQMSRLVERNWAAAWASLAQAHATPPTLANTDADCLRVYTPGEPESLLNMIMCYHGPEVRSARDLEPVIAPFRQWRLPFQWWMTRGSEPDGLRHALATLGMENWGGATMMALAPDSLDAAIGRAPYLNGVTLERVERVEEAEVALGIICEVFAIPREPMRRWTTLNPAFDMWLARLDGRPAAALATLRDGEAAGVYHVATITGARRRGLAGALLSQALRAARAHGCHWATLTATVEARSLYERLGFRVCGLMEQWMPGPGLSRALAGADGYTSRAR